jgi:hypothetical protein
MGGWICTVETRVDQDFIHNSNLAQAQMVRMSLYWFSVIRDRPFGNTLESRGHAQLRRLESSSV